jgi:hypothetical protein
VYDGEVCCVTSDSLAEAMQSEGVPNVKKTPDLSLLSQSLELLKIGLPLGRLEKGGASSFEAGRAAAEHALRGLDLPSMGVQVLHMHDWIDIVPAQSGKAAGLRAACALLGADLHRSVLIIIIIIIIIIILLE